MRIIARVDGCSGQAFRQVHQEETTIPIARLIDDAGLATEPLLSPYYSLSLYLLLHTTVGFYCLQHHSY